MVTATVGRARVIDLWGGNENVYYLKGFFTDSKFEVKSDIHPNLQRANACGCIAVYAALLLQSSQDWFREDLILPLSSNDDIVPIYNSALGYTPLQTPQWLSTEDIFRLIHLHSQDGSDEFWFGGTPPINLFLEGVMERIRNCSHGAAISIVNTSVAGMDEDARVGDHWITVAYEVYPQRDL